MTVHVFFFIINGIHCRTTIRLSSFSGLVFFSFRGIKCLRIIIFTVATNPILRVRTSISWQPGNRQFLSYLILLHSHIPSKIYWNKHNSCNSHVLKNSTCIVGLIKNSCFTESPPLGTFDVNSSWWVACYSRVIDSERSDRRDRRGNVSRSFWTTSNQFPEITFNCSRLPRRFIGSRDILLR